jgi:hypothetical protein
MLTLTKRAPLLPLRGTNIELMLGVPDQELQRINCFIPGQRKCLDPRQCPNGPNLWGCQQPTDSMVPANEQNKQS